MPRVAKTVLHPSPNRPGDAVHADRRVAPVHHANDRPLQPSVRPGELLEEAVERRPLEQLEALHHPLVVALLGFVGRERLHLLDLDHLLGLRDHGLGVLGGEHLLRQRVDFLGPLFVGRELGGIERTSDQIPKRHRVAWIPRPGELQPGHQVGGRNAHGHRRHRRHDLPQHRHLQRLGFTDLLLLDVYAGVDHGEPQNWK